MSAAFKILAPAKANLFLHITGKRDDGYHLLQSLMMFANTDDILSFESYPEFLLDINGPFSKGLSSSENLVAKAALGFCNFIGRKPEVKITLQKDIPVGAGLGGGSSDAAATIKGLIKLWDLDIERTALDNLLINLGADVPACFYTKSCIAEGIGDIIKPRATPALHAVLVYPDAPCATAPIFKNYSQQFSDNILVPEKFENQKSFINFLNHQKNDLTFSACALYPTVQDCLKIIKEQNNALLVRMSGSGSTCFGIFGNENEAISASQKISNAHPNWWVKAVTLS